MQKCEKLYNEPKTKFKEELTTKNNQMFSVGMSIFIFYTNTFYSFVQSMNVNQPIHGLTDNIWFCTILYYMLLLFLI